VFDLLIRGGTVVSAEHSLRADVGIRGETIAAVLTPDAAAPPATRVIDARGLFVIPGGMDPHVHFNLSYGPARSQGFRPGTIAAAAGGTTTVLHFAMQYGDEMPIEGVERAIKEADGEAVIDYGLHLALAGRFTPRVIDGLTAAIDFGVPSFKIYMIFGTQPGWEGGDGGTWAVMEHCRRRNGMTMVHCENASIVGHLTQEAKRAGRHAPRDVEQTRPSWVEEEAMRRAFFLAEKAETPLYVVHTSIKEGVRLSRQSRGRQLPHYVETLVTYLYFTDERTHAPDGGLFINYPPMRFAEDREALWQGIADNVVQTVGTDDFALYSGPRSQIGDHIDCIPAGISAIEQRIPAMMTMGVHTGRITMNQLVRAACTNPAKIFGLYPQKGVIAPGSDADIVLIDPNRRKRITIAEMHIDSDYTMWEGEEFLGYPVMTLSRGKVIVDRDQFVGTPGAGRFLARRVPADVAAGRF
jgi:dihydropyrimidinase